MAFLIWGGVIVSFARKDWTSLVVVLMGFVYFPFLIDFPMPFAFCLLLGTIDCALFSDAEYSIALEIANRCLEGAKYMPKP